MILTAAFGSRDECLYVIYLLLSNITQNFNGVTWKSFLGKN